MIQRTWVIFGATSIIADQFAHLAAHAGCYLRLVGRDLVALQLIANDIKLRYKVSCDLIVIDMNQPAEQLLTSIMLDESELDLFIAHSDFSDNQHLDTQSITELIQVNILSTTLIIHSYLKSNQTKHNLVYLSSVAACRGRAKNSLYGGSKAAIEVYLQGLQVAVSKTQHITIARLGFIDTKQTYGLPGIFYAAAPVDCAKACWNALYKKKRVVYYPHFWRIIMAIITRLPFIIFKKYV